MISLLGMDPISFALAILSFLTFIFSCIGVLRNFVPWRQYLRVADLFTQTRTLWNDLEKEGWLPSEDVVKLANLLEVLECLETEMESLVFVTMPTSNIIKILRVWSKSWTLLELTQRIDKIRVGLLMVSGQRKHIQLTKEKAERLGIHVDVSKLEEKSRETTEVLFSSLGDWRFSSSASYRDIETNAFRISPEPKTTEHVRRNSLPADSSRLSTWTTTSSPSLHRGREIGAPTSLMHPSLSGSYSSTDFATRSIWGSYLLAEIHIQKPEPSHSSNSLPPRHCTLPDTLQNSPAVGPS
ncbi:hypothetical protein BDZ97DRAFT_1916721 [Flammula alnicola]|nr:hypothetical protein BDZ97DRAFT_1916721 [Flammula alnicola]